jgi:hypothetical protein
MRFARIAGVTCVYRAWIERSSWPIRSSMSLLGVPSSSMSVRWVWRSPCGVRPAATGSQHRSERPEALRPRTGTPGHGSPSTGTGRTG